MANFNSTQGNGFGAALQEGMYHKFNRGPMKGYFRSPSGSLLTAINKAEGASCIGAQGEATSRFEYLGMRVRSNERQKGFVSQA